jgi:thioredoxin-related protein
VKRFMGPFTWFVLAFASGLLANEANGQTSVSAVRSSSVPTSSEIVWHNNLDSGWRESKRTGRPMVIFITSARCRYCDAMKAATWHDFGIENRVGSEFVAVRLTPEQNSVELSRISIKVFPTTLVALPQGKVIDHRTGFQPPNLLHGLLNRVAGRHPG